MMRTVDVGNLELNDDEAERARQAEPRRAEPFRARPAMPRPPHMVQNPADGAAYVLGAFVLGAVLLVILVFGWMAHQTHVAYNQEQERVRDAWRAEVDRRQRENPEREAMILYDVGVQWRDANRHQDAIWAFSEAIRLKPAFPQAYRERGSTYLRLRRYDEATRDFDSAARLRQDADSHTLRGTVNASKRN